MLSSPETLAFRRWLTLGPFGLIHPTGRHGFTPAPLRIVPAAPLARVDVPTVSPRAWVTTRFVTALTKASHLSGFATAPFLTWTALAHAPGTPAVPVWRFAMDLRPALSPPWAFRIPPWHPAHLPTPRLMPPIPWGALARNWLTLRYPTVIIPALRPGKGSTYYPPVPSPPKPVPPRPAHAVPP